GIEDVVADPREGPAADQLAPAHLLSVAAYFAVAGMVRPQAHGEWPPLEHGARVPALPQDVRRVGAAVVEGVELDVLEALVLGVHQRAGETPSVPFQPGREQGVEPRRGPRARVPRAVVVPPVHPGCRARLHDGLRSTAAGGGD